MPLKVYFLAPSLTSMITYVWARKNPNVHVSLMFILNFQAKYLPWVLLALYTFFEGAVPATEVIGITVGHIYFFLEEIVPKQTGRHVVKAPEFMYVKSFLWFFSNDKNTFGSKINPAFIFSRRNAFHRDDDPFVVRGEGNVLGGEDVRVA